LISDPTHTVFVLPDEPVVTITPGKSWSALRLHELWSHRGLLYFLIWRDLKVRYKQTLFGVAWVVMQPLLMTLIFTVFLGVLARVPTGGVPYPVLAYSGLMPWTFFSSAVVGCSYSLVGNAPLITKVYFPRILVPAASVGARLVDFAISFAILITLMFIYAIFLQYKLVLTWNLALLPLMIALTTLLAFGLGTIAAGLNVRYRDVGIALPVLIQLGMFVSPVLYPISFVPANWRTIYFLNPLAGLIDGFRVALLGGQINYFGLAVASGFVIASLVGAGLLFRSVEKGFADVI
jgi:lipopolysaccharide transport system permease protein